MCRNEAKPGFLDRYRTTTLFTLKSPPVKNFGKFWHFPSEACIIPLSHVCVVYAGESEGSRLGGSMLQAMVLEGSK